MKQLILEKMSTRSKSNILTKPREKFTKTSKHVTSENFFWETPSGFYQIPLLACLLSFFLSSRSYFFGKLIFLLLLLFFGKSVDLVSKTEGTIENFLLFYGIYSKAIFKHLFLVSCWGRSFLSKQMENI